MRIDRYINKYLLSYKLSVVIEVDMGCYWEKEERYLIFEGENGEYSRLIKIGI